MKYTKENIEKIADTFGYTNLTDSANGRTTFARNQDLLTIYNILTRFYGNNIYSISENRYEDGERSAFVLPLDTGLNGISRIHLVNNRTLSKTHSFEGVIDSEYLCPSISVKSCYYNENLSYEDPYSYEESDRVNYFHHINEIFDKRNGDEIVGVDISTTGDIDIESVRKSFISDIDHIDSSNLVMLLNELRSIYKIIMDKTSIDDKLSAAYSSYDLQIKLLEELYSKVVIAERLNPAYNAQMLLQKK